MMINPQKDEIKNIFDSWYEEKEFISSCFRKRDKQAAIEPMNQQIESFLQALFLINGIGSFSKEDLLTKIEQLPIQPINAKERIIFLKEKPAHYHSFIQLSELYDELRKQYEKSLAMK